MPTGRLVLEPLAPFHALRLFEALRDIRLYEFTDDQPPESLDWLRGRYRRLAARRSPDGTGRWLNRVVRLADNGRYVGDVQSTIRVNHSAEIPYVLFHDAWGYGYGREAVSLMLNRLRHDFEIPIFRAPVDRNNLRSLELVESLGFVQRLHDDANAMHPHDANTVCEYVLVQNRLAINDGTNSGTS